MAVGYKEDVDAMISRIDKVDGIYLKRNDLLEVHGCYGGKAECAYELMKEAKSKRFVTCGSRNSLQCEIVSKMCEVLGYECHVFIPKGSDTPSMLRMKENSLTELHPIEDGYMVVVKKRAADFAFENNMTLIPFGMQSPIAVHTIAKQVSNVPEDVKRIVVPVGGGITLCGVLQGLVDLKRYDVKVLGIVTGGNPNLTLRRYKPLFDPIDYNLLLYTDGTAIHRYEDKVECSVGDVKLDPIYEGKCKKYLTEGDLLWIVGYHEV